MIVCKPSGLDARYATIHSSAPAGMYWYLHGRRHGYARAFGQHPPNPRPLAGGVQDSVIICKSPAITRQRNPASLPPSRIFARPASDRTAEAAEKLG